MKRMHRGMVWLAVAMMGLATGPARAAVSLINLGSLGGSPTVIAQAINDSGVVVGVYQRPDFNLHAFQYKNGMMRDLDLRAVHQTYASGLNNAGLVVGAEIIQVTNELGVFSENRAVVFSKGTAVPLSLNRQVQDSDLGGINNSGVLIGTYIDLQGTTHAFREQRGLVTDLGNLGGSPTGPDAINDSGDIVGLSYLTSGGTDFHPFLYRHGLMRDLGTLGGTRGAALGINNRGDIVGFSSTTSNLETHPFLYRRGRMQDLGTLGGSQSPGVFIYSVDNAAAAINNQGQVVGRSLAPDNSEHAFLYANGRMTDLNDLVTLTTTNGPAGFLSLDNASDINNRSQIVGAGNYWDGTNIVIRAFLMDLR